MTWRKCFILCVCAAEVGVSYCGQWEFSVGVTQVKDSSSGTDIKVEGWGQFQDEHKLQIMNWMLY